MKKNAEISSESPASGGQQPNTKHILLLILIGIFVLSPGLRPSVISLESEERAWKATQNMLHTKNIMVPYLDGEPHLTKPPLFYWMGAITGFISHRDDPFIVRLPSVVCAIVMMVLTYLLGSNLNSRQVGFLAALILVSSNLFTGRANLGTFDIALSAAILLALYGGWQWINSQKKSGVILLFAGSWLGFMIKGPVAWLIIAIALIGQLAIRKELKRLVAWHTLIFIVILLIFSSLWFVYLIIYEPLAKNVFVDELLLVFGKTSPSSTAKHFKPIYQYLLDLPGNIIPWTVYLPMIVLFFFRRRQVICESLLRFPLIWFGGNFIFFSLVPKKQAAYLLPLYPAIAIIISWFLVAALQGQKQEKSWLRKTNIILGILCFPTGLALAILFWVRVSAPLILCILMGALFIAIGVGLIRASLLRKDKQALVYFLVGWLLIIPILYGYFMPKHKYIHEYKNSPEAKAYIERSEQLRRFFKIYR